MSRKFKVAVGGVLHETNTFMSTNADIADFEKGAGFPGLCYGDAILDEMKGVNCGLAGFIEAAPPSWELVPMVWAVAIPSGPVTTSAFDAIAGYIVETLTKTPDVDAIYLDLHGAMVTQDYADGEGELLRRVREAVGAQIPVVTSLDLHANVSPQMVDLSDVLIAYRTYPHIDMAETGKRCLRALEHMLISGERPKKALRQLDFLIPTIAQCTLSDPAKSIYEALNDLEQQAGIFSLTFNPAFPAADIADCRPSVLAYGWDDETVNSVADALAQLVIDAESDFEVPILTPEAAARYAVENGKPGRPVIIADTQDNPGGGSTSDTMGMLKALLHANAQNAAVGLIVDAQAAAAAHAAGTGSVVSLQLGGRGGFVGDTPLTADFIVEKLSDGVVQMSGGLYGVSIGQMGLSACLRVGGVQIAVCSNTSQMADQQQFRYLGIEPREKSILVVKSTIHYRASFDALGGLNIFAAAPGGMVADFTTLPWRNLPRRIRMKSTIGGTFSNTPEN